ncbi:MAG: CDP-glucose 4,6-dehydratase [Bacteroidetes bacterium]|nr:CDP-glucose 4,6-dehydratase [Bacteroidota bacterium]MBT5530661.1 CDP-glucose 4,6-dehydratase [Cytophagia bacterium]
MMNKLNEEYQDKKVLVTGHTGFKGSWLCILLNKLGADVYGYALEPPTVPSLFVEANVGELITSYIGDIRNLNYLNKVISKIKPEIVIHMAAQPLVLESYRDPIQTYETNVMGVVNLFEAVKNVAGIKAVLNVTTDKCYENKEWDWGYRENEPLGGYDPYSSSKACSEIVTASYRNSFFNPANFSEHGVAIASARAGNVIGGGDFADNRLIPDFINAISNKETVKIRNPHAIRPWQHVLEPITGYLILAKNLYLYGPKFTGAWNFGPNDNDARTVEWIIDSICKYWGKGASYLIDGVPKQHEAGFLKLDSSKARMKLGWTPNWDIEMTLKSIVEWNTALINGENAYDITSEQIDKYFSTN